MNIHFKTNSSWQKKSITCIPWLWFGLFLIAPVAIILGISFAHPTVDSPPFTPLFHLKNDTITFVISLKNYLSILSHKGFFIVFGDSLKLAGITTLLCIFLGYPLALAIAKSKPRYRNLLFLAVILPYWTSFILRAYAWINILQNNGLLNQWLLHLGVIHEPLRMIYTPFSVIIGLFYGYLPYFILPVYASLTKQDKTLLEAAEDLGSKPFQNFIKITLPLTLPSIIAGSLLVFIPAIGEVVIPQFLGGIHTVMIGNLIWQTFFTGNNWCLAAALSVLLLIIMLIPAIWLRHIQQKMEPTA